MIRLKLAILLGFAIMFVAGLAVGRSRQVASLAPLHSDDQLPNFRQKLELTAPQTQQIEKIWHDARGHADALTHQFHEIDRQRDDAISAMLAPDQKQQYESIQRQRDARLSTVHGEIQKIMQQAEIQTRALLTPEQQKTFDDLRKQHGHHRGPPGMLMGGEGPPPPMGGGHRHWHDGPDTQPATLP